MKYTKLIIAFALVSSSVSLSFGQTEEIKEWKKKLKTLTPEQYKTLVEDNNNLQKEVGDLKSESEHYRSESQSKDAQIAKLESQLKSLKDSMPATPAVAATPTPAPANSKTNMASNKPSVSGLVYKVQIGAFRNKNLQVYLNNHKNFSGDEDSDGTRKYTLGEFADYWEADRFKKYLREMGVKDAWIVSYKDGKRVEMKKALENAL